LDANTGCGTSEEDGRDDVETEYSSAKGRGQYGRAAKGAIAVSGLTSRLLTLKNKLHLR
jgi:hypothetical protein